ncbi:MAG TPA: hypothetical protein VF026_11245 [Ktedonobacteraceae bacterium]
MSFVDLAAVASAIITVITGVAAGVGYMSKNYKDKQAMAKVLVIALATVALFSAIFGVGVITTRPSIAVNHYTGVSLLGPAPTERSYNTVVVVTPPPTPPTITKTYNENRTLTCISSSCTKLGVVLNTIVVDTTHHSMTWNFTITNNGSAACTSMDVSLYLEDPTGKQIQGAQPGTLTEYNPIGAGQILQEYTTLAVVPQPGQTYTLHASPYCDTSGGSETDQLETFTFN